MSASTNALDKLLGQVPHGFDRKTSTSNVYMWFSAKNQRRLYCEGHVVDRLATLVEVDRFAAWFNERPPKIALPVSAGRSIDLAPLIASKDTQGTWTLHFVDRRGASGGPSLGDAEVDNALSEWAKLHRVELKFWLEEFVASQELYIANLQKLLRFTCVPNRPPVFELMGRLVSHIETVGQERVQELIASFPLEDPDRVLHATAQALLSGALFAQLQSRRFSLQSVVGSREQ